MVNNINHHNNTSHSSVKPQSIKSEMTMTLANGNIDSGLGQAQKCGRIKLVNGILPYFHYNKTLLEQKKPPHTNNIWRITNFSMGFIKMFLDSIYKSKFQYFWIILNQFSTFLILFNHKNKCNERKMYIILP